jgi:peptidoglycan hydrolase CwlO-like protein
MKMNETLELVKALMSSSQLTNAKLEALAMDVHRMSGDITGLTTEVGQLKNKVTELDSKVTVIDKKLDDTRDDLREFRIESRKSFRELKGHVRMISDDLEETIERVTVLEKSAK